MISLIDLLSPRYAPIQRVLLDHLNPGAIARLTCTCKAFGCLWPTLMASDYNINHKLRYFFKDPREFRSVQGECGALLEDCHQMFNAGGILSFIARSKVECTQLIVRSRPRRTRADSAPAINTLESLSWLGSDSSLVFSEQYTRL